MVNIKWTKFTIDPSNSVPDYDVIVNGDKHFHKIVSQMFVAMNKLIPLPNPCPFYNISSNNITMNPENVN